MPNMFEEAEGREGVFRNEKALLPEYMPPVLPFREAQLKEIVYALKPVTRNASPDNLFISGSTGTGKTSCVKYAFAQLQEYSQRAACVYINCWEYPGKQAVLSKLAEHFGEILPRRGLASDEIFSRVLQRARHDKKAIVVCLDEADRLFSREESLLYELSRSGENFGVHVGVIAISNNLELPALLDERARSSLRLRSLSFKSYSPIELKEILRERAKEAFVPGACPEEIIGLCAGHGAKNKGDARVAIEALRQSGRIAERKGRKKIESADAQAAFAAGADVSLKKNADFMNSHERMLIEILREAKAEGKEMTSRELYDAFYGRQKQAGEPLLSERQVRNYLDIFERAKIIETELVDAPGSEKGKTKRIKVIR